MIYAENTPAKRRRWHRFQVVAIVPAHDLPQHESFCLTARGAARECASLRRFSAGFIQYFSQPVDDNPIRVERGRP